MVGSKGEHMTQPFEGTIKMETVKDEEGNDKVVWDYAEPGSEWARVDKDLNLVHLNMDLCAQGPANVYTALAIGVWNAATKAEREACAKVVEALDGCAQYFPHVPDIIRNRKNT